MDTPVEYSAACERQVKATGETLTSPKRELFIAGGAKLNVRTDGQGNGGNITVNANTMDVANGGQVFTTSSSSGQGGDITLNVTQSVTLSGSDPTYEDRADRFPDRVSGLGSASGLFANTLQNSINQGGDLTVNTGQFISGWGASHCQE